MYVCCGEVNPLSEESRVRLFPCGERMFAGLKEHFIIGRTFMYVLINIVCTYVRK